MTTSAIVIGGSIGGLLAARVLSDHYDHVTVLERDEFGTYGEYRKGVAQARHAHGLLAGGSKTMEQLLPGLCEALIARGAVAGDLQDKAVWVNEGHTLARLPTTLRGLATSRLLVEDEIRNRVVAIPNVTVHTHVDVHGLSVDRSGRVDGAQVSWRDRDAAEEVLHADLVVDASGRGSRAAAWLDHLGYGTPAIEEIVVGLGYTTREFVRTTSDEESRIVICAGTVQDPRMGVVLPQPGGRYVVTLGGYLGDAAPGELDGFREFARTLPSQHLADTIDGLEPLGDPRTFKYHASTWRRFDKMKRFPEGFLVTGDAMCSFNPIYGQGMTVASREALLLDESLRAGHRNLAQRFFRAAAKEIRIPWDLAASSDLRIASVVGKRSAKTKFVNAYMRRYFVAAERDPQLALAFLQVINLLARPETLLTPAKVWRVLRGSRSAQQHQQERGDGQQRVAHERLGTDRSAA